MSSIEMLGKVFVNLIPNILPKYKMYTLVSLPQYTKHYLHFCTQSVLLRYMEDHP